MKNKKNGFTLIETITAFIVMLIVVSSVSLSITLTLKVNREQKMTNLANTISSDIINKLVRNQSFEYLYNYVDANGQSVKNNGIVLATRVVNGETGQVVSGSSNIETDKGFVKIPISSEIVSGSIQSQTFPDLKLLENGSAMLKIYPVITAYNNNGTIVPISSTSSNTGTPVISTTKISVNALVRWGKINSATGLPAFKIQLPTIVSKNGLYSITSIPTPTPVPTSTPTPTEVGLGNGFSCTSNTQCQSGNCSGGICQNP